MPEISTRIPSRIVAEVFHKIPAEVHLGISSKGLPRIDCKVSRGIRYKIPSEIYLSGFAECFPIVSSRILQDSGNFPENFPGFLLKFVDFFSRSF